MIKEELTNMSSIIKSNVDIYKAYVGDDIVWLKETVVTDNDGKDYNVKNYIAARGYYSYAVTPITGKSTDIIEIGFTITSRSSTNWCWLIGYLVSESNRFGIYPRRNANNTFTIDFWRGGSGSSRKYSTLVSTVNKRFDLVVGNPSLTATNLGYAYDTASKTTLVASGTSINTTNSSAKYTVSESRSGKANNRVKYYYVKIYKLANGTKTLVLDWIPVLRISDGVWGFYDRITKNFYPSLGSEQFTGG